MVPVLEMGAIMIAPTCQSNQNHKPKMTKNLIFIHTPVGAIKKETNLLHINIISKNINYYEMSFYGRIVNCKKLK